MDISKKKGTERFYRRKTAIRLFAFISGLVFAVLFSIALVRDFIPDRQIFAIGADMFELTQYFVLICIAVCFIYCRTAIPKESQAREGALENAPKSYEYTEYYKTDRKTVKFIRYACTAMLIAEGCVRLFLFFKGEMFSQPVVAVTVLSLILVFPLALYFSPELSDLTLPGYRKVHMVYGTIGLFWFIMMLVYFYFDKSVSLASPYRLMEQINLVFVLLAVIGEIRLHTSAPSKRGYLATLCAGFITSFSFTVGRIAMLFCGKFVSAEDTVYIFMGAAFALYLGMRMFFYDEY